jgi:hypothetical protein
MRDKALGLLFFIGCILTFLIAHQGYERFIRSTTSGVVHDIRQLYHNNKLQATFVMRRLGKQE